MNEADTTYLWQMPDDVEAKVFHASAPVSSINSIRTDMGSPRPCRFFVFLRNTFRPPLSA